MRYAYIYNCINMYKKKYICLCNIPTMCIHKYRDVNIENNIQVFLNIFDRIKQIIYKICNINAEIIIQMFGNPI